MYRYKNNVTYSVNCSQSVQYTCSKAVPTRSECVRKLLKVKLVKEINENVDSQSSAFKTFTTHKVCSLL